MKNKIRTGVRRGGAIAVTFAALLLPPFLAFAQTFKDPAKAPDIQTFIQEFLIAIVQISLPILTLFIVYAGFLFVTARGNPEKLNKAKTNFIYVIIGAILILGAWVLATLIASTATQVLGTS